MYLYQVNNVGQESLKKKDVVISIKTASAYYLVQFLPIDKSKFCK